MSRTELLSAIDRDREELIAFLQRLVQAPSPNPPGDTRLAASVVQDFLSQNGISTALVGPQLTMPNVVSEFQGDDDGKR